MACCEFGHNLAACGKDIANLLEVVSVLWSVTHSSHSLPTKLRSDGCPTPIRE
jgi:hypothetical protein